MKKVEHFKNMLKAIKDKRMASASDVVADLQDSNSQPSINPDEIPVNGKSVMNKGKDMAPNTWFHYDHPEHGKIEVAAHHDGKQAHIVSVGAVGDAHVHPKHDAGMSDESISAMSQHAMKLGPGQHMQKQEMNKSENFEVMEKSHKFHDVDFTRKPHEHSDVYHEINHDHPHLKDLPEHHEKDIMANPKHKLSSSFKKEMPQHFKMHGSDGSKYVVNTEGHDYPRYMARIKGDDDPMAKSEYSAEEIILQALKRVKAKKDEAMNKAEEMKRESKAEDMGSIYSKEQEVGNQNDIQEAAKRETAQLNGKKLKEFVEKIKNKSEKAAKSPLKKDKKDE